MTTCDASTCAPMLRCACSLQVGQDVRYLAEQVSHHPPICAAHAENMHFKYDLVSAPTTRFLGNSLEVYPYGEEPGWQAVGWVRGADCHSKEGPGWGYRTGRGARRPARCAYMGRQAMAARQGFDVG